MKYLLLPFLLVFALVFQNCNTKSRSSSQESKTIIRLSHSHPETFSSELHMTAWLFKQFVEEFSDELEVKIYGANALGQEREIIEALQIGSGASCYIGGTAILNNFIPEMGVLDLPYLWKDYGHIHDALDGEAGKELVRISSREGLKVLSFLDSWGYRNIVTASKVIENAEDLKGLKIRTIQAKNYIETINSMGMNATPMSFGEVYTGMQTGILDGFEHNAAAIQSAKLYEVAKHLVYTRHLFGAVAFTYSQKQWDKLTEHQKEAVQKAAQMASQIERSLAPVKEQEAIDFLVSKGMQIHNIDIEPFRSSSIALQNRLAENCNGLAILNAIRSCENQ
ncbi:MAG TPA: TRAP transporter substrate-binding protein [Bacteroides sp.]|nr:TRAP transporter substrate-binding protein [Bacteroides sp.]